MTEIVFQQKMPDEMSEPLDKMSEPLDETLSPIGHNRPPFDAFDAAKAEIDNLYDETLRWIEGGDIDTAERADGIANLRYELITAERRTDAARKAARAPHDRAVKEIDAAFTPLLTRARYAADACGIVLTAWLKKCADEHTAAVVQARCEADRKTRMAQIAFQSIREIDIANGADGTDEGSRAARAQAEELAEQAKLARRIADKTARRTITAGSVGRPAALRTRYRAEIIDVKDFASYAWKHHRIELTAFLTQLAQQQVREGKRQFPGVAVHEDRKVV